MSQAVSRIEPDDERIEHAIIRAAQDDSIDIAKLEALLNMQRSVQQERAVRMFNTAMAQAQSEMMQIPRDATNTHTKSRYARMETIDRLMRPIYTTHGFSVRFGSQPSPREGWMRIVCVVAHTGGHYEQNHLDAPPDEAGTKGTVNKTPIQSVGSSVTYLRRYLLCMVFNIVLSDDVDPDDDGEGGAPRAPAAPPDPLMEPNGTVWLRIVTKQVTEAASLDALAKIAGHKSVANAKANAPTLIRRQIEDMFRAAHERLAPPAETRTTWDDDPIAEMLAELAEMDLEGVEALPAAWSIKLRDLFPPDRERLDEAIADRKFVLRGKA
jgi:hypothetical protein